MKKFLSIIALLMAFAATGFADTWTVAGSAAVFGSNWNVGDENNDMTYDETSQVWTLTKNEVTLTEGTVYEYKVVLNHSWDNENYGAGGVWGGDNKTFYVSKSASYNVTITFDYSTKTLTEVCEEVGAAQNATISQVDLRGSFNSWSYSDDYKFTKGEGDVYTLSLTIDDLSDPTFKLVVNNGEWLGYESDMTIEASDGWIVDDGPNDHNFKLMNSITGYKTYLLTATWVANSSAVSGWTLTIEGGEQRTVHHSSVTFATGLNWNKVYAYVWKDDNGEITNIVEWPGIEMTVTDEEVVSCGEHFPVYGLALESFVDVNKVIFNDGTINDPEEGVNKTGVEEYQDAIPYRYMIPEPAEISSVILKGGWTTESTTMQKVGDTYVYTADIDLTDVLTDQNIQLFVNNGESALSNLTVDTEDGGIALTEGENGNYLLPNATSGYKDYTVTATWVESTDANVGWTIKVVGKTARPNATIGSVVLSWGIAGASTWNNVTLTKDADSDVYTGELELYNIEGNRDFQLVVDNNWLGYGELELTDPENLVTVAEGVENFTLKNATSPYETYTVTATWTANPNPFSGWELTIVGQDKRVYTYTLVNVAGWENVRAYAWNANGDVTDSWPGNVLDKDDDQIDGYDAYTYSVESSPAAKPTGIIFNNGGGIQTPNIPFEQNGIYYNGLAYYTIVAELFGDWIDTGFELEDNGDGTYSFDESFGSKNERFAIAPNTAIVNDIVTDWSQVIIPVTEGGDWLIDYFTNYSGTTKKGTSAANDKVWLMGFDDDNSPLTVTIDPENNTFTIESSATEAIAIGAAGYATYSNDKRFTVSGDDVEVYFVEEVGTNVKMTKKEDAVLPGGSGKGKGVLLKGSGNVIIKPAPADVADTDVSANLLAGSGNNTYVISGDFGNGDTYNAAYVLKNGEDGVGFYYINLAGSETDRTLAANKAFLAFNKSSDARGFIGFDDMTTGIETIENVQLTNGTVYNLNGQRVAQPTKGLYIVNGKKVLVK